MRVRQGNSVRVPVVHTGIAIHSQPVFVNGELTIESLVARASGRDGGHCCSGVVILVQIPPLEGVAREARGGQRQRGAFHVIDRLGVGVRNTAGRGAGQIEHVRDRVINRRPRGVKRRGCAQGDLAGPAGSIRRVCQLACTVLQFPAGEHISGTAEGVRPGHRIRRVDRHIRRAGHIARVRSFTCIGKQNA